MPCGACVVEQVNKHINALQIKKQETERWKKIKINENTMGIEVICFDMIISNLEYQIKWHETLLDEIDSCIILSNQMSEFIRQVDFSNANDIEEFMQVSQKTDIDRLKKEILEHPEKAAEKLDELINIIRMNKGT